MRRQDQTSPSPEPLAQALLEEVTEVGCAGGLGREENTHGKGSACPQPCEQPWLWMRAGKEPDVPHSWNLCPVTPVGARMTNQPHIAVGSLQRLFRWSCSEVLLSRASPSAWYQTVFLLPPCGLWPPSLSLSLQGLSESQTHQAARELCEPTGG